jgi:hypothetical protein
VRRRDHHTSATTRIPVPLALALRRVVIVVAAVAATLAAHAHAVGGIHLLRGAPLAWVGMLSIVAVAGPRGAWRPRGFTGAQLISLGVQMAAHVMLLATPWALGVVPHQTHAGIDASQLLPHVVAAVAIAFLVSGLERWLERAAAVVRVLRRWFARFHHPPLRRPRATPVAGSRPSERGGAARRTRGPPLLRPA